MTKHAPAPIATAADLFRLVAEDPRVKAYPRLVEKVKDMIREWRLHGSLTDSCRPMEALLRELGEL